MRVINFFCAGCTGSENCGKNPERVWWMEEEVRHHCSWHSCFNFAIIDCYACMCLWPFCCHGCIGGCCSYLKTLRQCRSLLASRALQDILVKLWNQKKKRKWLRWWEKLIKEGEAWAVRWLNALGSILLSSRREMLDDAHFRWRNRTCVPQGSLLGPLLFNMYQWS